MRRRTLLGFAIAPLLPVMALITMAAVVPPRDVTALAILRTLLLCSAISYAISLVVGIPTLLILSRVRLTNVLYYLAVGAVGGALPVAYFAIPSAYQCMTIEDAAYRAYCWETWSTDRNMLLIAALIGASVAGAFWLIARPDRPAALRRPEPA